MKKSNDIFLFIVFLCLIISCDDILEEDISNDLVQPIYPTEGINIEGNTVQFSWTELDGADEYRLQVSNSNQFVLLDSLVTNRNFQTTLDPGNYQWRVKAQNFAYDTDFTFPINFSVTASDNLTNQNVELLTPSNNIFTNNTSIIFTWTPISTADTYQLNILKVIDNAETTILQEQDLTSTNYSIASSLLNEDAEYKWKIKAVNTNSETNFSERSFFIDTNSPSQPSLSAPNDAEIITELDVNFNWLNGSDTGNVQSPVTNTLEISTNNSFSTLFYTEDTQNNSLLVTIDEFGVYYWRVIARDQAGNESEYSAVRSVDLQ